MTHATRPSLRRLAPIVAAVAALVLTGCGNYMAQPPVAKADYRDAHPLKVKLATTALVTGSASSVAVPGSRERTRLQGFVVDYLRRGRGPVTVSFGGSQTPEAVLRLRAVLAEEGVGPAEMEFKQARSNAVKDGNLIFSFRGYGVSVPDCGDWSGSAGYDPSNLPHTNFGCSYQRNMGLMLADPGDLAEPRAPVSMDARRNDGVIGVYRAGKAAGAGLPKNEVGNISTIGGTSAK